LWTRDAEAEIFPACRALGVAFVAYAPLGRGFLSGTFDRQRMVGQTRDIRNHLPRFQPGAFDANQALLSSLHAVAEQVGRLPAEVALAWVLAQGPFVHAIPGTRQPRHLVSNLAAASLTLTAGQVSQLAQAFHPAAVKGDRYPPHLLGTVNV
jgi:aryl-alcohol dehydrogenase-like predicted oxidoreductase